VTSVTNDRKCSRTVIILSYIDLSPPSIKSAQVDLKHPSSIPAAAINNSATCCGNIAANRNPAVNEIYHQASKL
jgi:hypothetical protein